MGRRNQEDIKATDALVELIGEARNHRIRKIDGTSEVPSDISTTGGAPLLPLRAHFFLRGLPRLSCCLKCGEVQQYGGMKCNENSCVGRVFELLSDRGSGEPYVRIWLPIRSGRVTRQGYQNCTVMNNHSATFIQPDGSLKGMGKGLQDPEKMLGLAAYRVKSDDDRATHRIHTVTGELKSLDVGDKPETPSNWAWLILPDFVKEEGFQIQAEFNGNNSMMTIPELLISRWTKVLKQITVMHYFHKQPIWKHVEMMLFPLQ